MNKKPKIKISVFDIKQLEKSLNEINKLDFDDIDFINNDGEVINIDPKHIKDWRYVGLNVTTFITSGFYLNGFVCG